MGYLLNAILLAILALTPLSATAGQPAAVVAAPLFEFQPVVEGTEVVHAFEVTNKGEGMLEITGVKTG